MTKAQRFLEELESLAPLPSEDSEDVENIVRLRANHSRGVRCLDCGRLLPRVYKLPSVRSCPNGECGSKYHISRLERGLGLRKL